MPSIQEALDQVPEPEREECAVTEVDTGDYIFDQPHARWFTVRGKNMVEMAGNEQPSYSRHWHFWADSPTVETEVGPIAIGGVFPESGQVVRRNRGE